MKCARRLSFRRVYCLWVGGLLILMVAVLFVFEGAIADWKHPVIHVSAESARVRDELDHAPKQVTVLTWNLAKAGFYEQSVPFLMSSETLARLDAMADIIRRENPEVVVLTEVVGRAGLGNDQVAYLAGALRMHSWTFGANYSFGIPGFSIQAGKAILTHGILSDARAVQLSGERWFWNPTNNRRLLLAELRLGARSWTIGAIRNDSFSVAHNLIHAREVLRICAGDQTMLAGDFNAEANSEAIKLFQNSGRFTGAFEGPSTFPSERPSNHGRRIDYIFAPKGWTLVSDRVIETTLSDHRPVVAEFRVP